MLLRTEIDWILLLNASEYRLWFPNERSHMKWKNVILAARGRNDIHSHISTLSKAILALEKARSRRKPNLSCRAADRPRWCDALPKRAYTRAVEWAGALSWWSWSALLVIVNATVTHYTRCQLRLTADWLAPRESDCSRTKSKVSSDWLPSSIKTTELVLGILKMAGYLQDRPRMCHIHQ